MGEERLAAIELLCTAELALEHHLDVIPRLSSLATEHPYREQLHALLITALYRSGRQADALNAYQNLRRRLRDELGIDPSRELVALETDVLLQSSSLQPSPGESDVLSSFLREASRLAFASGSLIDAAALTGAVKRIAEQPDVTLAVFVLEQACKLRVGLAGSLGTEAADREVQRGTALDTSEAFEIVRRCLTNHGSTRPSVASAEPAAVRLIGRGQRTVGAFGNERTHRRAARSQQHYCQQETSG